jgi:hypothetical protein
MRKIIGFNLPMRIKEIQRRAKKAKVAVPEEPQLQEILDAALKAIKPSVLFETFDHTDSDQEVLSPMPGLAYSLVVATLGEGFTAFAAEHGKLGEVVAETALDECVRFCSSLLEDEAAKDSCELSPLSPLTEDAALEAAVKKLDGAKIGVAVENGRLCPAASAAVSLSWLAKSKAKKGK